MIEETDSKCSTLLTKRKRKLFYKKVSLDRCSHYLKVFLLSFLSIMTTCFAETLLGCQSEWPKYNPFLLMHSRCARNLYNSKIKTIFEISSTFFEIILFIHLNKALGWSQKHFMKKIYNGVLFTTLYILSKKIWFSCIGPFILQPLF